MLVKKYPRAGVPVISARGRQKQNQIRGIYNRFHGSWIWSFQKVTLCQTGIGAVHKVRTLYFRVSKPPTPLCMQASDHPPPYASHITSQYLKITTNCRFISNASVIINYGNTVIWNNYWRPRIQHHVENVPVNGDIFPPRDDDRLTFNFWNAFI